MTATSGLRHCDLNDLCRTVERPLNGRRIVVATYVTTALATQARNDDDDDDDNNINITITITINIDTDININQYWY